MVSRNRREFLSDVGKGMLVATVGADTAVELGLAPAMADDGREALTFGELEPLVCLMQETPKERLLPLLVDRLRSGTDLKRLVAGAALANARTFGGEDYIGFHTMMAMSPAYHMAQELPAERQALPVLKVLYRNTSRIQDTGGRKAEVLHPVQAAAAGVVTGEAMRDAGRRKDTGAAEGMFAAAVHSSPKEALDELLLTVRESIDVHRVVLPYRAWALLDVVGMDHAHTMLRQSVRFCLQAESARNATWDEPEKLLPKLLEQYHLLDRKPGERSGDDAWVEELSKTIYRSDAAHAAEAAAAALADGFAPSSVGAAVSLAANQLVLRDPGRPANQETPGKPIGSVHGDSVGVHACDSVNAWRNLARVGSPWNTFACVILGAYHVARDRGYRGELLSVEPLPVTYHVNQIKTTDAKQLLTDTEAAIRDNQQAHASALVYRYGHLGLPARPEFDLMLRYAISEDGALHAEKYYRTVSEEFAWGRPAFRWRQLVALARVTASEYGRPAPGYAQACELLKA